MTPDNPSGAGLSPASEAELAALIAERFAARLPLRIAGGGTRVETGAVPGELMSTAAISGVVTYEPGEMTLIARVGTPLDQIRAMLAAEGQALAFEPADMRGVLGRNGTPTIGGVVAANASGPRRLLAGACRDHLLGVRFVDGQGRVLKNGGRVMKNVTGLDLGKLFCGAHGTLGVLTEVALKTLPHLPDRCTLGFHGVTIEEAVAIFSAALATPFEVSGAAFRDGSAWLRVEGLGPQMTYRRDRLLALLAPREAEVLDDAATLALWCELRDLAHFAGADAPLWRVLVKPSDAPAAARALQALGGEASLDWGGGLVWYCGPGTVQAVRQVAPHATLVRRGGLDGPAFPPEAPAVARLSAGLRHRFDPAGILNPGLMDS
ncbi:MULTISPECIES: FAD-binding protein [Paracoccus]|uniref:Glycolate oxidase FAD binding subunit n=1 Tax=Paracoccus versutus TaxID=34007 RepID=A0A3D9XNP6_PARVE|nr:MULTISPECIES: FAD-binding protein [Paracoccus]REF72077.1 glycolate oxidase FAD binding subunit [Paracoccus versutus]WGR55927.1 FAD-binding protein [Paracoccus versutus]